MTKVEELLGVLLPEEQREEMDKIFEEYEHLDRATLMALLLQNELTLLKLRKEVQDQIKEGLRNMTSSERLFELALMADRNHRQIIFSGARHHSKSYAIVVAQYKRYFIERAIDWFRHQKEEIGISWFEDYAIRFREAMEDV